MGGILHKDDLSSKQASKLHFNGKVGWKKKNRTRRPTSCLFPSVLAGLSTTVEEEKSRQELLESGFPSPQKPFYQGEFSVFFWVNGKLRIRCLFSIFLPEVGWESCSKVSRSTSTKFSRKNLHQTCW